MPDGFDHETDSGEMSSVPDIYDRRTAKRWVDRRKASTGEVVAVVTLIIQLCALVWAAATLTSSVGRLSEIATQLQAGQTTIQADIVTLKLDVGVLKAGAKK
jgi:hypothetical protein